MKFKKGESGNPGGVSKTAKEIRELARQNCPHAIRKLIKLLESKDERTVIAAAKELMDRGLGKAPQAIVGADGEGPVLARIERVIIAAGQEVEEEHEDLVVH